MTCFPAGRLPSPDHLIDNYGLESNCDPDTNCLDGERIPCRDKNTHHLSVLILGTYSCRAEGVPQAVELSPARPTVASKIAVEAGRTVRDYASTTTAEEVLVNSTISLSRLKTA